MPTQDALDRAVDDFAAGRALDDTSHRLVARAARAFAAMPGRQRAAVLYQEGIRARDRFIAELAETHCDGLRGVKPKADKIAAWARTYEGTAWIRDKLSTSCPDNITGRPEAMIWRALKAHPIFPRDRQLREILARSTS